MTSVRRLTDHFTPTRYDLSLDIDRVGRSFSGLVAIEGAMAQTGPLYVHAKDLMITQVHVDGNATEYIQGEHDELCIGTNFKAEESHIVTIAFSGTITEQMHGMYPCFYSHENQSHELIATQFESHHAREVFPCLDEPEAKAAFDVTLTTESGITVLGNMPVRSQSEADGRLVTTFEQTPRMSSYLLAWVYGNLHKKSAHTKSGVEVNIWATPAQPTSSLDFALDIATRTIDFFDDYFGVPYPLPKSDHVALPDFSSGAMENWGLITYREVALLADPASASVSTKQRVAMVVAHELSHQWFGNLVTMKWWNNLWLNESFANLMEYVALDALEPGWNVWLDFASYESVMALRRDAIDGVQAVQVDVSHPDEISTLFDPAIVYAKGSRLLRMLERHIGQDAFRTGLSEYFKAHAYQNTDEHDLWSALSRSSGQDINALMKPWISQPGFPVVHVTNQSLTQERFFIGTHSASSSIWPIPLGSNDESLPEVLSNQAIEISATHPVYLNIVDSAHFITHYEPEAIEHLLSDVDTGVLPPTRRLQLLDEQMLLARAGVITSAQLIPIIRRYTNETEESVWDLLAATVGELKKFVETDESSELALRNMAGELAAQQYERLGWSARQDESESDTKLRATIIGMMLYSERQDVLNEAEALYTSGYKTIDPELRSLVFSSVVKHRKDRAIFSELLDAYTQTSSAELQQDIAAGLTATPHADEITLLLSRMMDPKKVRGQDVARWFVYLIRSRYGRVLAWQWVQDNWSWIEQTFGGDKSFDDYPRYAATGLVTTDQLDSYRAFFMPLREKTALRRVIDMGMREIESRVELIEHDASAVRTALLDRA